MKCKQYQGRTLLCDTLEMMSIGNRAFLYMYKKNINKKKVTFFYNDNITKRPTWSEETGGWFFILADMFLLKDIYLPLFPLSSSFILFCFSYCALDQMVPGWSGWKSRSGIFKLILAVDGWSLVKLPWDVDNWTLLITSQHGCTWWLGG